MRQHSGATSPTHRTGATLKRTRQVWCHPSAIKTARLRRRLPITDVTLIDLVRIEGQEPSDGCETLRRIRIEPSDHWHAYSARHFKIQIACRAFPFAKRTTAGGMHPVQSAIARREIVGRRMAGFQNAETLRCFGDGLAGMNNPQPMPGGLQCRWSRIVPNGFLSRADRVGCRSHVMMLAGCPATPLSTVAGCASIQTPYPHRRRP